MATGSAATAARPQISARLPVSDWQIRWRLQPDGRTVLEVTDQAGNLTGLVASTRLPITSVDGAWCARSFKMRMTASFMVRMCGCVEGPADGSRRGLGVRGGA